jgi:hypothetical protein
MTGKIRVSKYDLSNSNIMIKKEKGKNKQLPGKIC